MRYHYGASDEKYVKLPNTEGRKKPNALSSYTFHLDAITRGKSLFDRHDMPIVFKCSPDSLLNICAKVVDAFPLPSVFEWDIEDICKWLRDYGYRQYQHTFRENHINGRTLLLLDASALCAMNIKDFDHIKHIAYGIRSLFYFEMSKFGRSLTLYPEFHDELFKLFRVKTGAKYENVQRSELWRKLQIIRQREPIRTHWEILERWLWFDRDSAEMFGGIRRNTIYRCSGQSTIATTVAKRRKSCPCMPPCECKWTADNRRAPWTLKCLANLQTDNEFVKTCRGCVPPCTCRWTSKKYMTNCVLYCLQAALPLK